MSKEKQIEEKSCRKCLHYCACLRNSEYYPDRPCFSYEDKEDYRKQEWISVEERLPKRNGRYLTHCKIEGQSLVCVLYYCKVGGFNEGMVTHWMPLPEPPKMKGGE